MSIALRRKTGAGIAIVGAIVAALGALSHLSVPIAVGIAVICIVMGTGVARGYFSSTSDPDNGNSH